MLSIAEGTLLAAVEWDKQAKGRGTYVAIKHPNGLVSEYWHLNGLSKAIVELKKKGENQPVSQGFLLGFAGDTGDQTDIHLHLRISLPWHGLEIDGYQIWMHRTVASSSDGFNYQGSATQGTTKNHEINLSDPTCHNRGNRRATAVVDLNFSGTEERNSSDGGIDQKTLFAEQRSGVPKAPMQSSNQIDEKTRE